MAKSRKILMYQNSEFKLYEDTTDIEASIEIIEKYYADLGKSFLEISEAFSIRMYQVDIVSGSNLTKCTIHKILPSLKLQKIESSVIWDFKGLYKGHRLEFQLVDNKDVIYTIWDVLEQVLEMENKRTIKDLTFKLDVRIKESQRKSTNDYNQKQKLILFFSKPGNWGVKWKYSKLTKAMAKDGLQMVGRGIEGERPREFRYDLGYPFITSEQDNKVPDGYCIVRHPFPTLPRNERRNPTMNLDREDWSELLEVLKKDPTRLRCFECGLFEEETNKMGQKTKFQKSHLVSHLTGGDVSKENIVAICQYCNSEQKNIFNYHPITGKKIYQTISFIKDRDVNTKIEVLEFLLKTLKIEIIQKVLKNNNLLK